MSLTVVEVFAAQSLDSICHRAVNGGLCPLHFVHVERIQTSSPAQCLFWQSSTDDSRMKRVRCYAGPFESGGQFHGEQDVTVFGLAVEESTWKELLQIFHVQNGEDSQDGSNIDDPSRSGLFGFQNGICKIYTAFQNGLFCSDGMTIVVNQNGEGSISLLFQKCNTNEIDVGMR